MLASVWYIGLNGAMSGLVTIRFMISMHVIIVVSKMIARDKSVRLGHHLETHWDLHLEFQMLVALRVITTSE